MLCVQFRIKAASRAIQELERLQQPIIGPQVLHSSTGGSNCSDRAAQQHNNIWTMLHLISMLAVQMSRCPNGIESAGVKLAMAWQP